MRRAGKDLAPLHSAPNPTYKARLRSRPAGHAVAASHAFNLELFARRLHMRPARPHEKESKMPKMKTKSGAKKRFKITGTGKV